MNRRFHATREQLIPDGYSEILRDDVNGVLVVADSNQICLMAFSGKSNKPAFYTRFRSVDNAKVYLTKWHQSIINRAAEKIAVREANKLFVNPLVLGQIISSSWGYEQTNVSFYQVTKLIGKQTVEVREIGFIEHSIESMQGYKVPAPNSFKGEPSRHRVGEHGRVKISHAYATPVEFTDVAGVRLYKPQRYSSYA